MFLPTTALKVTKKPAELHYSFPMKQKNNYGHQQQQPKKSSSTCIRMDEIEKPTPQKGHTLSSKEAWGKGDWQVGVHLLLAKTASSGVQRGLSQTRPQDCGHTLCMFP